MNEALTFIISNYLGLVFLTLPWNFSVKGSIYMGTVQPLSCPGLWAAGSSRIAIEQQDGQGTTVATRGASVRRQWHSHSRLWMGGSPLCLGSPSAGVGDKVCSHFLKEGQEALFQWLKNVAALVVIKWTLKVGRNFQMSLNLPRHCLSISHSACVCMFNFTYLRI